MSRFKVEVLCFALQHTSNAEKFRADPDGFLSGYSLTRAEREAVTRGDIGALYEMGVSTFALSSLSRAFGYDDVAYVRALRAAAGLPERTDQIEVLQERARRRQRQPTSN